MKAKEKGKGKGKEKGKEKEAHDVRREEQMRMLGRGLTARKQ